MKIMTFNVGIWTRNIRRSDPNWWKPRYKAMRDFIANERPDIICLQEALFPTDIYLKPKGYKFAGFSITHPIFVRKSAKVTYHRFGIHHEIAVVDGMTVINIHSHWDEGILLQDIEFVNKWSNGKTIACGDFNNSFFAIRSGGIADHLYSARCRMGLPERDTFVNFNNPDSHGEIDHLFFNYHFFDVKQYRCPQYGYKGEDGEEHRMSDHYPVIVELI